ncbi:uncharacterized protein LOC110852452 [Folsomia candida]|uniref:Uncharacterized protein n=1 Tax=Folsomia candida TaxID=158441 RepID=A0A226E3X7_FOLCA|nr:uncharacterized protein LOC110852452 [Folsomia candida]OXA51978.1 hypothetical protein Fcan01_13057 [Folsomia candida]
MAELSGIGLIAIIGAAVVILVILPLICCCIFCGWCCSCCCGPRRQKPGAVHIHQQQVPPTGPLSTTIAVQSTNQPQQGYNGYPQSDQIRGPDFSPWNDANAYLGRESNNAGFQSSSYHQYNNYNGNHQPTRNYYAEQRYKPLTEFGLNRSAYPDVHPYESNQHSPRNYLGQSHHDIYQPAHQYQNRYGRGAQQYRKY